MNVLVIEDEERAANRLIQLLNQIAPGFNVYTNLQSIKEVVSFNWEETDISLIFMDIHLADGSCFEIFKHIDLDVPIIFTTAYDQYAIDAFKVNSVDYLLKPIQEKELNEAILKFQKKTNKEQSIQLSELISLFQKEDRVSLKNLLVHHKQKLIPVPVDQFGYFYIENGLVKGLTLQNETYFLDQNLDDLENSLDSKLFYRANRQLIIRDQCVAGIEPYFNSRLLVHTSHHLPFEVIISKAKAREFKNWLQTT